MIRKFYEAEDHGAFIDWQKEYSKLTQALEKKDKEIAELKAWKESAMSVMPPMQEIAKALGVRLGESIHDKILPGIERLKGIIEKMFRDSKTHATVSVFTDHIKEVELKWQQFKTENQL